MTYSNTGLILLKISCVLWVIWGLVHVMAGFIIIPSDASAGIAAIADAVDPTLVKMDYPDALGAILNQHGFNLIWIGVVTIVGGVFIWRGTTAAIFVSGLVGGLADIGYFVFIDLGGFNNFMPGTLMTVFSASAIIFSAYAYFKERKE